MFRVRRIHQDAIIPTKAHILDAGFDVYSIGAVDIPARSQSVIETGLELVQLPDASINGYWATGMFLWPRSGLDAQCSLTTGAGVVDFIYRGKILVLLKNQSDVHVHVPYGKAIAQAVIQPVWIGDVEEVCYSGESERGKSGGIVNALHE